MPSISFLLWVLLLQFLPLHSAEQKDDRHPHHWNCLPSFSCGKLGEIKFPFTKRKQSECGLFPVKDCENEREDLPKVQLETGGRWYQLQSISQADIMTIFDKDLAKLKQLQLQTKDCKSLKNLSLPILPYVSFNVLSTLTICKCNNTALNASFLKEFNHSVCEPYTLYYNQSQEMEMPNDRFSSLCNCPIIQLPIISPPDKNSLNRTSLNYHSPNTTSLHKNPLFDPLIPNISVKADPLFELLTPEFSVEVHVSDECWNCHWRGGQCLVNKMKKFYCSKEDKHLGLKLGLGTGLPVTLTILILSICLVWRQCKQKYSSSSSKSDLESSSIVCFGHPIFTYSELVEATNNFDDQKQLGEGGFGTVYFGKLRDGREVAIKRLYQHNYRRLEQFINEVEILTCLHHKNLVSFYGCTSSHSRELLLVYEFIPNGTVADHLHGDCLQSSSLKWHIRMSIAIETASALVYLHATGIIHRDVKTKNILLDNNFSVKVADFGLSRLFPDDVTHISTAPQGTPGYVDPEYHKCYQLTKKSDVYSFGVVLIELISSMPAVDTTRHRHEITLAILAINKIQKSAFDELIDPNTGYKSDEEVTRMTTLVAELAFRCLQQEKEMRPSMEEVLEELLRIQSEDHKLKNKQEEQAHNAMPESVQPPPSPPNGDQISLLKNIQTPPSPISVTDKWVSQSTTPNTSG